MNQPTPRAKWFESYRCGCVSKNESRKKDLLGIYRELDRNQMVKPWEDRCGGRHESIPSQ